MVKEPSGTHVAERFVVTVRFTIRSDAHQLRFVAVRVKSILDALTKNIGVAEKMFKSDSARKPRVVEENVQVTIADLVAFGVDREDAVRTGRIDVRIFTTLPRIIRAAERTEL